MEMVDEYNSDDQESSNDSDNNHNEDEMPDLVGQDYDNLSSNEESDVKEEVENIGVRRTRGNRASFMHSQVARDTRNTARQGQAECHGQQKR